LFRELGNEFKGRWSADMKSAADVRDAKVSWWTHIHDLSKEEIQHALSVMPTGKDAWPPGPREFRKLARSNRPAQPATYLPSPPRTRDQHQAALGHLQAIRTLLPQVPVAAAVLPQADGAVPDDPEAAAPLVDPLAQRRAFLDRHAEDLHALGLARFARERPVTQPLDAP
jgi:hypothetical protein